jgi:transcriptional regulator of acetoin/glycerol metabolism
MQSLLAPVHLRHGAAAVTFREAMLAAGKAYLERVLQEKQGNVSKAAMEAGVSRTHFYRLMVRHGISRA